jgi:hypothetical protein
VFLGKNYNGEKFNFNFSYNLSPCICLVSIFFEPNHIEKSFPHLNSTKLSISLDKFLSTSSAIPPSGSYLVFLFCFCLDLYDDRDICEKKMLRIIKFAFDFQVKIKTFIFVSIRKEKYFKSDISDDPKSIRIIEENSE